MRTLPIFLMLLLTLAIASCASTAAPTGKELKTEAAQSCQKIVGTELSHLKGRLEGSGLIVVLRHAATDDNLPPIGDCLQPERRLSDPGKFQARDIHTVFDHFGLAKWKGYHSPACRTIETADLVLTPGSSESKPQLYYTYANSLVELLMATSKAIPEGKHVLLVTHSTNIETLQVRGQKIILRDREDFGIAVIFDPSVNLTAISPEAWFLGCLWPEDWKDLLVKPDGEEAPHNTY